MRSRGLGGVGGRWPVKGRRPSPRLPVRKKCGARLRPTRPPAAFDYFAGAPLPKRREALPGLIDMTLPAGTYARFKHEGHIATVRATCGAVYETGLPALGREADTRWFSFTEYYGPDFEPSTGLGTVEIWVKLKG